MNFGYGMPNNMNISCNMCSGSGFIIDSFGMQQQCRCQIRMGCNQCNGTGYFMNMNGFQQPCQCIIAPGTVIYPNRHHRNLFQYLGDKFQAIFGCGRCSGNGWIYSKYGNQTYCPSCITANGFCPKCNNTGFKIRNGRSCNHSFY
jgi:hypothetical protein